MHSRSFPRCKPCPLIAAFAVAVRPPLPRLTFAWLLLLLLSPLSAHPGIQNNMQITFSEDAMLVTTEVALREILLVHGLRDEDQGGLDADAVAAAATRHEAYLKDHFEVTNMGQSFTGSVASHTAPSVHTTPSHTKYLFRLRFLLGHQRPAQLTLRQTMLREFSVTAGHLWHVDYIIRVNRADGKTELASLSPSQQVTIHTGLEAGSFSSNSRSPAVPPSGSASLFSTFRIPIAILLVVLGALGIVAFIYQRRSRPRSRP